MLMVSCANMPWTWFFRLNFGQSLSHSDIYRHSCCTGAYVMRMQLVALVACERQGLYEVTLRAIRCHKMLTRARVRRSRSSVAVLLAESRLSGMANKADRRA